MAVKIRLARHGAKKYPYYRVVVADGRSPRDGRFICEVGRYNPNVNPKLVELDIEAIDEWVKKGAQPTDTVARLIKVVREGGQIAIDESKKAPSKKAQAKAAEAQKAQEDAAAEGEASADEGAASEPAAGAEGEEAAPAAEE